MELDWCRVSQVCSMMSEFRNRMELIPECATLRNRMYSLHNDIKGCGYCVDVEQTERKRKTKTSYLLLVQITLKR